MNHFVSVSEAKSIIKNQISLTPKHELPILDALGFYTAETITATMDVPSFDNSAMDGYGFRFEDLKDSSELKVVETVQAGIATDNFILGKGEAVRIFTGAKIPDGVDTVVVQEKVERNDNKIYFDKTTVNKGDNIRPKASQTKSGTTIVEKNTHVNHAVIGFLAGFGIEKVAVYQRLKIGLVYTGNELVELGQPIKEGEIYNSNSYTLRAALQEINHEFTLIQHTKDIAEATYSKLKSALDEVDILLVTGGISVGDYDYVKPALERIGVTELFYKINQKPGKPLFFGKLKKKTVFALPGNPASVFSCFHQYVKPFILGCFGRNNFEEDMDFAISESSVKKKTKEQTQFLKAVYKQGKVRILGAQESYKMDSAAQANCLLEFPEGTTAINVDEKVKIWKI
ncbi:MAG: gephyrin-like molybdotransferase Glp [Moheibacter sp.]